MNAPQTRLLTNFFLLLLAGTSFAGPMERGIPDGPGSEEAVSDQAARNRCRESQAVTGQEPDLARGIEVTAVDSFVAPSASLTDEIVGAPAGASQLGKRTYEGEAVPRKAPQFGFVSGNPSVPRLGTGRRRVTFADPLEGLRELQESTIAARASEYSLNHLSPMPLRDPSVANGAEVFQASVARAEVPTSGSHDEIEQKMARVWEHALRAARQNKPDLSLKYKTAANYLKAFRDTRETDDLKEEQYLGLFQSYYKLARVLEKKNPMAAESYARAIQCFENTSGMDLSSFMAQTLTDAAQAFYAAGQATQKNQLDLASFFTQAGECYQRAVEIGDSNKSLTKKWYNVAVTSSRAGEAMQNGNAEASRLYAEVASCYKELIEIGPTDIRKEKLKKKADDFFEAAKAAEEAVDQAASSSQSSEDAAAAEEPAVS